jgi:hypothetical protein
MLNPQLLYALLKEEVFKALGLPSTSWIRSWIERWIHRPVSAFARISAEFEEKVNRESFSEAAKQILPYFVKSVRVTGAESIPSAGPLLLVSNHPGTCDSLIIASQVPRRDLKILAGNINFLKLMPATQQHLIHTTTDSFDRMAVLRKGLRHLKNDGAFLIFGSGGLDPDPVSMTGAEKEIERWSPSLSFLIEKVPDIQLVLAITSGVLSPKFIKHPLTLLQKGRRNKQRTSEFLQVFRQVTAPGSLNIHPRTTFSNLIIPASDFSKGELVLDQVIRIGKSLLARHQTSEPMSSR